MDGWGLGFVFLLPLSLCVDSRVNIVKTTRRGPDMTPVCVDGRFSVNLSATCSIRTDGRQKDRCNLMYGQGRPFVHPCDSKFRLINVNQTLFIRFTNVTSEDSGNYTCECSYDGRTQAVHLSVTVEDEEKSITLALMVVAAVVTVTASVIISGVVCCCVRRRNHLGQNPPGCDLRRSETLQTLDQEEHYTNLQWPTGDLYQTLSSWAHDGGTSQTGTDTTNHFIYQEVRESELNSIYENISG